MSPNLANADRPELVAQLSEWLNDPDGLLDGRFTTAEFCEWADRAIEVIDDPKFLGLLKSNSSRLSLATWAERSGDLATNPWSQVGNHIETIRESLGWPEVYDD